MLWVSYESNWGTTSLDKIIPTDPLERSPFLLQSIPLLQLLSTTLINFFEALSFIWIILWITTIDRLEVWIKGFYSHSYSFITWWYFPCRVLEFIFDWKPFLHFSIIRHLEKMEIFKSSKFWTLKKKSPSLDYFFLLTFCNNQEFQHSTWQCT